LSPASTFIAVAIVVWPGVPSGLCETASVVFDDVHFHALRMIAGLDVAVFATRAWRRGIKIVVDANVGRTCVHVELNVSAD